MHFRFVDHNVWSRFYTNRVLSEEAAPVTLLDVLYCYSCALKSGKTSQVWVAIQMVLEILDLTWIKWITIYRQNHFRTKHKAIGHYQEKSRVLICGYKTSSIDADITCSISLHFWKQNSMDISSVVDSCSAHIFRSTAMLEVILYHCTLFSKQPDFNSDNRIRMNLNRTIFKWGDIPTGNHLIRGCPLCLLIVFSVL